MMGGPALRELIHTQVKSGNTRLVVDLSGVGLIDSSGLSALISGYKAARQAGGSLHIARTPDNIRAILKMANLHRVLESVDLSVEGEPNQRDVIGEDTTRSRGEKGVDEVIE